MSLAYDYKMKHNSQNVEFVCTQISTSENVTHASHKLKANSSKLKSIFTCKMLRYSAFSDITDDAVVPK